MAAVLIVGSLALSAADRSGYSIDGPPRRVTPLADGDFTLECLLKRLMGLPCDESNPNPDPEPEPPLEPTNPLI